MIPIIDTHFPAMFDNLSLRDLKSKFTEVTGFPAKKAFAAIAAPSSCDRAMRSKSDWVWVLEHIEQKVVNTADWEKLTTKAQFAESAVVEEADVIDDVLTEVFTQAFTKADDAKQLRRKLSKRLHPDAGGSALLFRAMEEGYQLFTENQFNFATDYGFTQQWEPQYSGKGVSSVTDEELRDLLG